MSKYEDQTDSNDVICPYCKYEYQPESEDFSEDPRAEVCEECGMVYDVHQSFTVSHQTSPDCELNGKEHKWEMIKLKSGSEHEFCTVCDKCRPFK